MDGCSGRNEEIMILSLHQLRGVILERDASQRHCADQFFSLLIWQLTLDDEKLRNKIVAGKCVLVSCLRAIEVLPEYFWICGQQLSHQRLADARPFFLR